MCTCRPRSEHDDGVTVKCYRRCRPHRRVICKARLVLPLGTQGYGCRNARLVSEYGGGMTLASSIFH